MLTRGDAGRCPCVKKHTHDSATCHKAAGLKAGVSHADACHRLLPPIRSSEMGQIHEPGGGAYSKVTRAWEALTPLGGAKTQNRGGYRYSKRKMRA